MTYAPGSRALDASDSELRRDAVRTLQAAAEQIPDATESGDDALLFWLGQQIAAAVMQLERDDDMAAMLARAMQDGWDKRGAAMEEASRCRRLRVAGT
jgi:hypothetical protein